LTSRANLQRDEEFFACKWSVDEETGSALLLAAGKNNIMRVLDVSRGTLLWVRPAVCLTCMRCRPPSSGCHVC